MLRACSSYGPRCICGGFHSNILKRKNAVKVLALTAFLWFLAAATTAVSIAIAFTTATTTVICTEKKNDDYKNNNPRT